MSLSPDYDQQIHDLAIKQIVADLAEEKATVGVNHMNMIESYTQKLSTLSCMGIAMSRNALIKRVYNVSKNSPHGVVGVELTVEDDGTDDMAGLTPDTGVSSGSESKKYTGRPKGSTDDKKREDEKKRVECINAICDSYSNETIKRSTVKSRVPAGFLAGLIMSKQEEYGILEYISKETI